MDKTFENKLSRIYIVYAFVAVFYQILLLVVPIGVRIGEHFPWITPALTWWGIGLLVLDAVTKQHFWEKKFTAPLLILLAVMVLSSVSWIQYGNSSQNAKVILEQAVQMLVLFPLGRRMSWDAIRRFFKALYIAVSAVWVPAMGISFLQYAYAVFYFEDYRRQGFGGGRLYGLFYPMHFGMATTVLLLCISVYYTLTAKKTWIRIWTGLEAVLCLFLIILSQTRNTIIALLAALFLCLGLYLYTRLTKKQYSVFRKLCVSGGAALGASILLMLLCLAANTGLKQIPATIIPQIQQELSVGESLSLPHKIGFRLASLFSTSGEGPVRDIETVRLERKNMTGDITSNNRLSIWNSYLSAISHDLHSLLLGYTPGRYRQIIFDRFPDLFIVTYIRDNNPALYQQNLAYDAHSAYICLLATTGLAGTCAMLWFLLRCLMAVLRCEAERRTYDYYFLLAGLLLILLTAGMDCDLFFKTTNTSMLFWLLAGVLLKRVGAFEEQQDSLS